MKTVLYLLLPVLAALGLETGTGTLSGLVKDKKSGETIAFANVVLEQKGIVITGAVTDFDGHYSVKDIKPGTYDIKITSVGYTTAIRAGVEIADGAELSENFELETGTTLSEATIHESKVVERVTSSSSVSIERMDVSVSSSSGKSKGSSKGASKGSRSEAVSEVSGGAPALSFSWSGSAGVKAADATFDYEAAPAAEGMKMAESGRLKEEASAKAASESMLKAESEKKAAESAAAAKMEEPARATYEKRLAEESAKLEAELGARESKAKMMAEPERLSKAGKLTAGNWCDNKNFEFFTDVLKKDDWSKMKSKWKFNPEERYVVKVKKGKEIVKDVAVRLKDRSGRVIWESRTDNKGEAFLFANLFDKSESAFEVEVGDKTNFVSQTLPRGTAAPVEIDFAGAAASGKLLDIMFMIDATGSMSDELSYVQDELSDVISRVKRTQQQMLTVRVSNNVYRDKGDDYVVRSFPFTENMSVALAQLNEQQTGGGGDYEEAVEAAFEDAIKNHEWSESAAARLMFFVLDAPPHVTAENIKTLQEVTKLAAAKGIRVIPVASSGVDKDTEFLMRFLSVSTGGTYVFLTDHSGVGNSHIEPTIGKYDVEFLNDLLVKVINSYLEEGELMTKK